MLTAWVRISRISMEHSNKYFLLEKKEKKIRRLIRTDETISIIKRGQDTCMCVEIDLSNHLLSKFPINGEVWLKL